MFCQLSRGLKWGQSEFFHCVRHLFIVCGRSYLISYLCSCRSVSFFFLLGTERECGCRRVGQPASNMTRICSLEHRWSSGRIRPCHGRDPGSIPGRCSMKLQSNVPTFCQLSVADFACDFGGNRASGVCLRDVFVARRRVFPQLFFRQLLKETVPFFSKEATQKLPPVFFTVHFPSHLHIQLE